MTIIFFIEIYTIPVMVDDSFCQTEYTFLHPSTFISASLGLSYLRLYFVHHSGVQWIT